MNKKNLNIIYISLSDKEPSDSFQYSFPPSPVLPIILFSAIAASKAGKPKPSRLEQYTAEKYKKAHTIGVPLNI